MEDETDVCVRSLKMATELEVATPILFLRAVLCAYLHTVKTQMDRNNNCFRPMNIIRSIWCSRQEGRFILYQPH